MSTENQSNHTDLFGGIALGVATLAALAIANSPFGPQYAALLDTVGEVRVGPAVLTKNLEHWINDGLMALFFLLVGLEIKREVLQGSLASPRRRCCPSWAQPADFSFRRSSTQPSIGTIRRRSMVGPYRRQRTSRSLSESALCLDV